MAKLKAGEKYLSVKLIGHEFVAAFPNKDKKNEREPDFKGDGIAVWIRTKKSEEEKKTTLESPKIEVYS